MKLHLIEKKVVTAIRDLSLELAVMGSGQKTKHGESKDHLRSELTCLRAIASLIDKHNLDEMRAHHQKTSLLNREGQ